MSPKCSIPHLSKQDCNEIQKVIEKYLMGMIISRSSGGVLYYIKIDPDLKVDLFSNFISALAMFGEEIVNIKTILIKGYKVELSIFAKNDLLITTFYRPDMVNEYFDEEAKKSLNLFYNQFKREIELKKTNQYLYEKFNDTMWQLIYDYLIRTGLIKKI